MTDQDGPLGTPPPMRRSIELLLLSVRRLRVKATFTYTALRTAPDGDAWADLGPFIAGLGHSAAAAEELLRSELESRR